MGLLKKIFGSSDENKPVSSYAAFWEWFAQHEKTFHAVIKEGNEIERKFLKVIAPKIEAVHQDIYYVAGMHDDTTAELILTAEGLLENIVFVEEFIACAPNLTGWKFTAHKQAFGDAEFEIKMYDLVFSKNKLSFYSPISNDYPDEIDITIVHEDFSPRNEKNIRQGTYIYLDNLLGELRAATTIDSLNIVGPTNATQELVPIEKLNDFLIWREKEFIQKYEHVRHNTNEDKYAVLKAEMEDGSMLIATINSDIMHWEAKASHPWMTNLEIEFPVTNDGFPNEETFELLNTLEDEILEQLVPTQGYLNIGRETLGNTRTIFFACNDFRKPSLVFTNIAKKYAPNLSITYDIFKDKYWRSLDKFKI